MACPNANVHNEKIRRLDMFAAVILHAYYNNPQLFNAVKALTLETNRTPAVESIDVAGEIYRVAEIMQAASETH